MEGAMEHYIFQNRNILMNGGRPLLALDKQSKVARSIKNGRIQESWPFLDLEFSP